MTDKLELKSSHEVVYTVDVADVDSIFHGKPIDPDILTVVMKDGKRLYCDEVCHIDFLQEEPVNRTLADIEAAMQEVEEKSKAFTEVHQGEDADTILAQMRGEEPVSNVVDDSDISCDAELCANHAGCKYFNPNKKNNVNHCIGGLPLQLRQKKEEPVSDDLKEAAVNAFKQIVDSDKNNFLEIFKAGAQWQKTKDESTTEDLGEYINELSKQFPEVSFAKLSRIAFRVAKWQKQQMVAKAIDGVVTFDYYDSGNKTYGCVAHDSFCLEDFGLKDRDKVKVIVIKED